MINKSLLIFCTLFVFTLGMQSCKQNPKIEEKKFIKIYSEMIFMQDSSSSLTQNEIKIKVLKKFDTSKNDFDETIKFYNEEPERWQKFFDSTIAYIEKLNPNFKKPDAKSLPKRSLSLEKKNL
jgi:hypothetical protein